MSHVLLKTVKFKPLLEVIKTNFHFILNLCYVPLGNFLAPYYSYLKWDFFRGVYIFKTLS